MTAIYIDPPSDIRGRAWAETEEDVATFRAEWKAKGYKVTARRKYETFMGERFRKEKSVIKLTWETL